MNGPLGLHDRFMDYISEQRLLNDQQRVLLALSGGMDSMTMLDLFRNSPYPFGIAHCNFKLRGRDADLDQALVQKTAEDLGVAFFSIAFNTVSFAKQHKISIQLAARNLRYKWLEKIRNENAFDLVATAHHADDAIETLLFNLIRGCGISGLKGIPVRSGNVIRPMLFATREEITKYIAEHNLNYREDLSNQENKYTRNKIRQEVIPVLKNINPGLTKVLQEFFRHMEGVEEIYRQGIADVIKLCLQYHGDEMQILLSPIMKVKRYDVVLYEILQAFGFSSGQCRDISANPARQPGKMFHSPSHTLLTEREKFLVFPSTQGSLPGNKRIQSNTTTLTFGRYRFHFSHDAPTSDISFKKHADPNTAMFDFDRLSFPLILRKWSAGDRMVPLGMKGSKKISDILTDSKIPLHRKNETAVIESDGQIIWLAGLKCSHPFRVRSGTKRIFRVSIQQISGFNG